MNQCEGQISLTELLQSKIQTKTVMDLTEWINSQGKAQYEQIEELVKLRCHDFDITEDSEKIDRLTNSISVYVLEQSIGYMEYLRKESTV